MLGPQLRIQSADTLRRLLAYLGATPEQLADFDNSHRRWGQGTVQITLQPERKNLLTIDYSLPDMAQAMPGRRICDSCAPSIPSMLSGRTQGNVVRRGASLRWLRHLSRLHAK
jgi:hypothetical protein